MYYLSQFASTYDSAAYGASTYETGSTANTSTTNGSSAGSTAAGTAASTNIGASLTNTGFDILLSATLACVIIFAALLTRFWKRPAKYRLSK